MPLNLAISLSTFEEWVCVLWYGWTAIIIVTFPHLILLPTDHKSLDVSTTQLRPHNFQMLLLLILESSLLDFANSWEFSVSFKFLEFLLFSKLKDTNEMFDYHNCGTEGVSFFSFCWLLNINFSFFIFKVEISGKM